MDLRFSAKTVARMSPLLPLLREGREFGIRVVATQEVLDALAASGHPNAGQVAGNILAVARIPEVLPSVPAVTPLLRTDQTPLFLAGMALLITVLANTTTTLVAGSTASGAVQMGATLSAIGYGFGALIAVVAVASWLHSRYLQRAPQMPRDVADEYVEQLIAAKEVLGTESPFAICVVATQEAYEALKQSGLTSAPSVLARISVVERLP